MNWINRCTGGLRKKSSSILIAHLSGSCDRIKHNMKLPIYMDYQATTPTDPDVLARMLPYFSEKFGNPHSKSHSFGRDSEQAVERAREQVARLINANSPKEIVFTSGATESNNNILKGAAYFYRATKNHIVTTQIEHKCVLDSCRFLEQDGFSVTYLPVNRQGLVDLEQLASSITDKTLLVSVMHVNNEIGTVQPLEQIGHICRTKNVFFHTDAAQAFGKIPIDVQRMNIDLMSISGHKIYGPKGVGAMYVRSTKPRIRLQPLMSGGGQERGFRSGTLPTPLVVGLGAAAEKAMINLQVDYAKVKYLSDRLVDGLTKQLTHITRNGDAVNGFPGCVNFSFAAVEGESLMMYMKDIALSSGSACTSASLEPSYVLRAIGCEEDLAHCSIRFGIGKMTTEEEIDYVIQSTVDQVNRLREMSPLWEMIQEGVDVRSINWTH